MSPRLRRKKSPRSFTSRSSLPKDGESLQSLAQTDSDSALGKDGNFVVSSDYFYASIKPQNGAAIFGNDATPASYITQPDEVTRAILAAGEAGSSVGAIA